MQNLFNSSSHPEGILMVATRYTDMVKLQEAPQVIATPTGPYTTSRSREIVMPTKRTTPLVDCAQCGASFVPATRPGYVQKFCGWACSRAARRLGGDPVVRRRDYHSAWLAPRRAASQAFVADVNARTFCAHCGAQPIEWHNPEHVELNRQGFRISALASNGLPPEAIQAEMNRCTPLCRRCHMAEDGRLARFIESRRAAIAASTVGLVPCSACERPSKPLRRRLCGRCYDRRYRPNRNFRKAPVLVRDSVAEVCGTVHNVPKPPREAPS
jgi:hypothetical protein